MNQLGFIHDRSRKIRPSWLQFVQLLFYWVVVSEKSGPTKGLAGSVTTLNGTRQVVKEGANLTLTCSSNNKHHMWWTLPDNLTKNPLHQGIGRLGMTLVSNVTHATSTVTVSNVQIEDTGYYTCHVQSASRRRGYTSQQYVYVYNDVQLVLLDDMLYHHYDCRQGDSVHVPCRPTHPNVTFHLIRNTRITAKGYKWEQSPNLLSEPNRKWLMQPERGLTLRDATIADSGQYQCIGKMNNITDWEYFQINVKGIELIRMGEDDDPLEGTNVTLICRTHAERELSSPPLWAYRQVTDIEGTMRIINDTSTTAVNTEYYNDLYSRHLKTIITGRERVWRYYESRIELIDLTLNDNITFYCQVNKDKETMSQHLSFRVKERTGQSILNLIQLEKGNAKNLTCIGSLQRNSIQWLKDDKPYLGGVDSAGSSSTLLLKGIIDEVGNYVCRWNNSRGQLRQRNFSVFWATIGSNTTAIPISMNLAAVIIIIGIGIKLYIDKKKPLLPTAEKRVEGNVQHVSQQLKIEEQIELLPYDKRWEFPKNRLTLGIQLGAGCFGRVVKAEAVGIEGSDEHVKTVAVKMVRSKTNVLALEALVSEMKILMHLGSHLNVVNLLGTCTKQIDQGELLIIVEYCRFGNLQTYLINHRHSFINLMDAFGNMRSDEEMHKILNDYADATIPRLGSEIENPEFPVLESIDDPNQEPRSFWHYQDDSDATLIRSVSTRDLISWSFQIARAMDYLASRNVLHGDLAARNVLLADDGVVKVADFGMARKMYLDTNYEKKGQGLMPIRWMAIESLTDRIFSSQSDVWSYGILLWEIFSLGKIPYPGMDVSHQLVREIQNGYRMEKPENATNTMGKIMMDCWKTDPKERPTFRQLQEMIQDHIESSVSSDYWSLNFPYANLNEEELDVSAKDNFLLATQSTDNKAKRKPHS